MEGHDIVKSARLGIRGLFRISIIVVVVMAYFCISTLSFISVSTDERAKAEASVRSEINYLCLQLESNATRAQTFNDITGSLGVDPKAMESEDPEGYHLLSDPVGEVLEGYTLAETGTVFLVSDGVVIASDDARVPVGSNAAELLGTQVSDAIETSLASSQMQTIPFDGVFDEPGGPGAYGNQDSEAFLMAGKQGGYTVVVIEPTEMVYRDRQGVMARQTTLTLAILIVVSIIVDRLLSYTVARRIDKTNEALERITNGELDTRVERRGMREFLSLASGINTTVEALQGWIAEAETRMASELAAARAIQESVLPRTFPPYPDIRKFDLYAIMDAAKEVGGDFYDFFPIGEIEPERGKIAFLVADVSGKGVPAALFMMEAKAQVRRELQSGLSVSEAIENANAELADGNDACMFVTMWVGVLDYASGRVEYVNAGHNPPLFWREGTGWSWLKARSGIPLGLMEGAAYKAYTVDFGIDDKILLYTDGVSEAMSQDGGMYGEDRLEVLANANCESRPEELVKAVRRDVAAFATGAEQSDDITVLVLEFGVPADEA